MKLCPAAARMLNEPAGLRNEMDCAARGDGTMGVRRTEPRKAMFAVPSLIGTALGFQLFAVVQLSFVPPPSQTWACVATAAASRAATTQVNLGVVIKVRAFSMADLRSH